MLCGGRTVLLPMSGEIRGQPIGEQSRNLQAASEPGKRGGRQGAAVQLKIILEGFLPCRYYLYCRNSRIWGSFSLDDLGIRSKTDLRCRGEGVWGDEDERFACVSTRRQKRMSSWQSSRKSITPT
jgi:hypothetical protein